VVVVERPIEIGFVVVKTVVVGTTVGEGEIKFWAVVAEDSLEMDSDLTSAVVSCSALATFASTVVGSGAGSLDLLLKPVKYKLC